jgi:hypothetical protein
MVPCKRGNESSIRVVEFHGQVTDCLSFVVNKYNSSQMACVQEPIGVRYR